MEIISVRDDPDSVQMFIDYFTERWASELTKPIYQNCLENTVNENYPLPQWYLMLGVSDEIIGGVGLITNDFISRMDLWPWLCALYVEEPHRNKGCGAALIEHVCAEAGRLEFDKVYLATDLIGYYERHKFAYIGDGYHPWGESSRIYERQVVQKKKNDRQ